MITVNSRDLIHAVITKWHSCFRRHRLQIPQIFRGAHGHRRPYIPLILCSLGALWFTLPPKPFNFINAIPNINQKSILQYYGLHIAEYISIYPAISSVMIR